MRSARAANVSRSSVAIIVAAVVFVALYKRGYRVEFKDGAVLTLAPEMTQALPVIDRVWRRVTGREPTLTSGRRAEVAGAPFSFHWLGKAGDFRTNDLPSPGVETALKIKLRDELRRELNSAFGAGVYDVVYETRIIKNGEMLREEHMHIEHDPR